MKIAEMQLELDVHRRAVDDMQTRQHALQSDKKRLEEVIASFGDANEVRPRPGGNRCLRQLRIGFVDCGGSCGRAAPA